MTPAASLAAAGRETPDKAPTGTRRSAGQPRRWPHRNRLAAVRRVDTPLGPVTLAATAHGLAGLWFDAQQHHPGELDLPAGDSPARRQADALLDMAARQLADWFAGGRTGFDLPLDAAGTPFQQAVWRALAALPYGTTCSYGTLAGAAGHPGAVRAVAAAIGRNPLSLVVPCHRVVGRDGALTGYAGGLERKQALLALEARVAAAPAGSPATPPAHETLAR